MNEIARELIIIFLLLIVNGVFAMAEIAVVSARRARLHQLVEEGNSQAKTALALAEQPTRFLSTVQIGISSIGILAGAFGGATLSEEIAGWIAAFPLLAPYAEAIGIAIVVIFITYFSLVIGELVPKRIGLNNAERIAMAIAPAMGVLSTAARPIVWFLSISTEAVLRLLRIQPSSDPGITEEEIKVLIDQGTQIGVFEVVEQDMIEGVLRLGDRRVNLIMTPRPQIVFLYIDDTLDEMRAKIAESRHSRFPVVDESLDDVIGILYVKELLAQFISNQPVDVRALLRPALYVPETVSVLKVLELLRQQGSQMALVADEFGGVEGLVTSDDILEAIVGDLPSADDGDSTQPVQREDGSYLLDGMMHIDDFKDLLDTEWLPREDEVGYTTVGGFVVSQIGNIPKAGAKFEWNNLRFEVMDMDGRRVDKVLMQPLAEPTELNDTE